MPSDAPPLLNIVPGECLVLFSVLASGTVAMLACPPARFLEGLRAACALLGFGEVQRDEDRLDELLPWTGNV